MGDWGHQRAYKPKLKRKKKKSGIGLNRSKRRKKEIPGEQRQDMKKRETAQKKTARNRKERWTQNNPKQGQTEGETTPTWSSKTSTNQSIWPAQGKAETGATTSSARLIKGNAAREKGAPREGTNRKRMIAGEGGNRTGRRPKQRTPNGTKSGFHGGVSRKKSKREREKKTMSERTTQEKKGGQLDPERGKKVQSHGRPKT